MCRRGPAYRIRSLDSLNGANVNSRVVFRRRGLCRFQGAVRDSAVGAQRPPTSKSRVSSTKVTMPRTGRSTVRADTGPTPRSKGLTLARVRQCHLDTAWRQRPTPRETEFACVPVSRLGVGGAVVQPRAITNAYVPISCGPPCPPAPGPGPCVGWTRVCPGLLRTPADPCLRSHQPAARRVTSPRHVRTYPPHDHGYGPQQSHSGQDHGNTVSYSNHLAMPDIAPAPPVSHQ